MQNPDPLNVISGLHVLLRVRTHVLSIPPLGVFVSADLPTSERERPRVKPDSSPSPLDTTLLLEYIILCCWLKRQSSGSSRQAFIHPFPELGNQAGVSV